MIEHYLLESLVTIFINEKEQRVFRPFSYNDLLSDEELEKLKEPKYINIESKEDVQQLLRTYPNIFKKDTRIHKWGGDEDYIEFEITNGEFDRFNLKNKVTVKIQFTNIIISRYYNLKRLLAKYNNQKVLAFINSELNKIEQMERGESILYILERTV